jgi:hypothetical protein
MGKKFAPIFFSAILFWFSAAPALADVMGRVFTDLPATHWAAAKIYDLVGRKWLSGYPDDTFLPGQKVTRAELAAMIARAAGKDQQPPQKHAFADVSENNWYYVPVEAAGEFFLRDSSLAEGLFRPEDPATRQEAATAIALAAGLPESDPSGIRESFTDYDSILTAYRGIISSAVKEKIITGYPDGTFGPDGQLTRAEAAVMIGNAFLKESEKPNDGENAVIKGILDALPPEALSKTPEEFKPVLDNLEDLQVFDLVSFEFFIDEIAPRGDKQDKTVVVFARVDPFKYATFSDGIFRSNAERVKAHAEKIAEEASKALPGRKVAAVIGYTNLNFNRNAADIFGSEYTSYVPEEDGWRVKRFYAAALAQDGAAPETWVAQAKGGNI